METRKVTMTAENYNEQMSALKRLSESTECALLYPFIGGSTVTMPCCGGIHPYYHLKSPSTMPKETNTFLYVDEQGKSLRVATYKDSNRRNDLELMSAIEDVQVMNDRVIMVKFADGTTEKAVLNKNDTFSVEQGIAICLTKKLLSTLTRGNGGSVYNKLVEYGLKTYEAIEERKAEVAKENDEKVAKAKRDAEKAQRKRERKAAEQREADIEIQKEAYLRAMRELNADK